MPSAVSMDTTATLVVNGADEKAISPLRQIPLRLLGYTNEVGESFKPFIPRSAYLGSYGIATSYVIADTFHQAWLTHGSLKNSGNDGSKKNTNLVCAAAADAFVWQMLASVCVPGLVVNRIVAASTFALQQIPKRPTWCRGLPTVIGLLSIPAIVGPIDDGVHWAMDHTYRPFAAKLHSPEESTQSTR
eukprot:gnl/MRDRNA2_/MRDRNA2_41429_c0_seq1.p1 gnl/MRDRNA2_/MRDRNA2_41429_c0~~gnl/MRDRNA2_/MRDRNA2_41429_c0_seq1.p1  ORF type:complete len:206 (-),score=27.73 gnl/MRDRNA2_/MRDRNA2_41429_c0_seq1:99-662(-)